MTGGAVGVGVSNLRSTRRLGSFGGFSSMFSRFARPDTARSHDDGGAGLGLALSAAIARAQGPYPRAGRQLGRGIDVPPSSALTVS
jgi:hypothetical protein